MENLAYWTGQYSDTVACHKRIVDTFTKLVNETDYLNAHRTLVEQEVYGFGDRSFHWMWKLITDTLPDNFKFLEIGVYKGQVLSLMALFAQKRNIAARIYGVTPLSTFAGEKGIFSPFPDTNYRQHIINLHNLFDLPFNFDDQIIVGDSTARATVDRVRQLAPFDVVYIDGCHEYDYVARDILNYAPMVKPGGYLVIDDASNFLNMPSGYFNGIIEVSRAVRDILERDVSFKPLLAVMHNRLFQKAYI